MTDISGWNFSMANYDAVWGFMVQFGLLLMFLMLGNVLRRTIPFFRKCLIPSALLGGAVLLIVDIICKQMGIILVDNRLMQVITYHCLGIGFAAMSLKTEKRAHQTNGMQVVEFGALQGGCYMMQVITYHCLGIGFAAMSLKTEKRAHQTNGTQVVEFGALQGGCYMMQAFVGLGITIGLFLLTKHSGKVVSYVCGVILPLAYGQGPGNALSWDVNFSNIPAAQFAGNGSFGLSLASIGFVVASVLGVLYINVYKKRGNLQVRPERPAGTVVDQSNPTGDEIADSESVDKFTLQMGFVVMAYAMSFALMYLLGILSDFTNSIAWGFNFLWASLAAMLIRFVVKGLRKQNLMHHGYINNYQMDRISGFAFDLMIVAGVAAIEINDIKNYILPVVILSVVGAVITYIYIHRVSRQCFKGFEHELFLMCYGTMTGTASNGMILMKEIDPGLRTPTSSLYILSNFPAMVMIAPLLFLLGFAAQSFRHAVVACIIFFALWLAYTVFLFRRKIFKKRYKDAPAPVWKDEDAVPNTEQ